MLFDVRSDLTTKHVGDDLIIHDSSNGDVHVLNATAAEVFQLCDGSRTPEEIAKALTEAFEGVEYAQAYEDVRQTLDALEAKHLVVQIKR